MTESVCYFTIVKENAERAEKIFRKEKLPVRCCYCPYSDLKAKVQELYREGVRVFMARGTLVPVLERETRTGVIPIRYDFIEFLEAIERAGEISGRIALVGWYSDEAWLNEYIRHLPPNVRHYPLTWSEKPDYEELVEAIRRCKEDGMEVVVGGYLPVLEAKKAGLNGVMITVSNGAFISAARNALRESTILRERELRITQMKAVMKHVEDGLILVDPGGRILEINKKVRELIPEIWRAGEISELNGDLKLEQCMQDQFIRGRTRPEPYVVTHNGKRLLITVSCSDERRKEKELLICIREAEKIVEEEKALRRDLVRQGLYARYQFSDIIGESGEMQKLKRKAASYAETDETVLIYGETGSGKELFAQSIHNASRRKTGPFVAVNCAAIPESILESELFGYVRGAFTGARTEGKPGLFELADKGTLFLDEIGEISFSLQAKLLRVLQEHQIVRLGDKRVISVDVRIIAATNQDLTVAVAEKRFREDLFYRLCVLPLTIPPLRFRREDIMDLIRFYLDKSGIEEYKWDRDCSELLTSYTWPGNIRELTSFVKRLEILHPAPPITTKELGEILLPLKGYSQEETSKAETKKAEPSEKERILEALKECGGNRTMAAKKLGMDRTTLWRKLKEK